MKSTLYHGFRFPKAIIQHAIYIYLRFTLSLRDVEELLAERGIIVTYETVGYAQVWCMAVRRRLAPRLSERARRRGS
jgi:putative transposase